MSFTSFNLHACLLQAVEACGYEIPTPVQTEAIPVVLAGKDVMVSAQTGTGKTAAFVLPSLHRLIDNPPGKGRGPRMLVLTPTRELAQQVDDDIRQFSTYTDFRHGSIVGGVSYQPQLRLLERPLDLLVATPGRLLDHMQQQRVDFSRLEILVLDEADRMLDMGFIGDIRKIVSKVPKDRQTLLFSATLEGAVLSMAKSFLRDPVKLQLTTNRQTHDSIEQRMHRADDMRHKHALLKHYLQEENLTQAVVFTSTKRGADLLASRLTEDGLPTAALHGDMRQSARRRTMDEIHRGRIRILVATDVAARGLDFKEISHVFNFDLPPVPEDYIHRIGRTGRASASGTAISLVGPNDWDYLMGIERLTGTKIQRDLIPGLEPKSKEPQRRAATFSTGRTWRPRARGRRGAARAPRRA